MSRRIFWIAIVLLALHVPGLAGEGSSPSIELEKVWETEGEFRQALLDPASGNAVLYGVERPKDQRPLRRIQVIRSTDGHLVSHLDLYPTLKSAGLIPTHQRPCNQRGSPPLPPEPEDLGALYDDEPRFSDKGRFMAFLRWRYSREFRDYRPRLLVYRLAPAGYQLAWECSIHRFQNHESSFQHRARAPGEGPSEYVVLPEGQVLFEDSLRGQLESARETVLYDRGRLVRRFAWKDRYGFESVGYQGILMNETETTLVYSCGPASEDNSKSSTIIGIGTDLNLKWNLRFDHLPLHLPYQKIGTSLPFWARITSTSLEPTGLRSHGEESKYCLIAPNGNTSVPFNLQNDSFPTYIEVIDPHYAVFHVSFPSTSDHRFYLVDLSNRSKFLDLSLETALSEIKSLNLLNEDRLILLSVLINTDSIPNEVKLYGRVADAIPFELYSSISPGKIDPNPFSNLQVEEHSILLAFSFLSSTGPKTRIILLQSTSGENNAFLN